MARVPYDAVNDVLVPLPAVEVPDDGGEPDAYVPAGLPSPWTREVPRGNPGPGHSIVDPEWDPEAFAHLGVPSCAVYTLEEVSQDEDGHTWLAAYTSERLLPPGTRRWREVGVRELITMTTADEARINPDHALQTSLNKNLPLDRWPAPLDLQCCTP